MKPCPLCSATTPEERLDILEASAPVGLCDNCTAIRDLAWKSGRATAAEERARLDATITPPRVVSPGGIAPPFLSAEAELSGEDASALRGFFVDHW